MRQFEFPYNFDKNLISILNILDPLGKSVNCIYLPPFLQDYQTILRNPEQADFLNKMDRIEYESHIQFINSLFPNKIQLLLQKEDILLQENEIKYYLNLGIKKYCVASIKQAQLIKKIIPDANIIGSIAMQINIEKIQNNLEEFSLYFDGFVLPFSASRDLNNIKKLPKNFYYILLINAYCNIHCNGKNHWNYTYKESYDVKCPGILTSDKNNSIPWEKSARIRPMDLGFFDRYIYIYKLQDRGWPTEDILRDYILYTSDFSIYPGINYEERMYFNE